MSKESDAKAIKKLAETKAKNKTERVQRRLEGNDSARTRDGGTNRRNLAGQVRRVLAVLGRAWTWMGDAAEASYRGQRES